MSIEIGDYVVTFDILGNPKSLKVRADFKNEITGKWACRDKLFTITDFNGVKPTKIMIQNKIKNWLFTNPIDKETLPDGSIKETIGKSIFESMKEETQMSVEIIKSYIQGEKNSLVGETIQETL